MMTQVPLQNLRICLAQINTTVGEISGNCRKISDAIATAQTAGSDIVVFPEMTITGYMPEDLLYKPKFIGDAMHALYGLAGSVGDIVAVVGCVDRDAEGLYNAAAVIWQGKIHAIYHKMCLPNYSVFDEKRYFIPGKVPLVLSVAGVLVGITICEDIWDKQGPIASQANMGARLILNLNASPYVQGKLENRQAFVARQARSYDVTVCYTNLVGGQDELVFDGGSMVYTAEGQQVGMAPLFSEASLLVDLACPKHAHGNVVSLDKFVAQEKPPLVSAPLSVYEDPVERVYQALVLGVSDYVEKNGFEHVVLGLSGGIDSALVALIACDALEHNRVHAVSMPSRFSSEGTQQDAITVAGNLNISLQHIPIESLFKTYLEVLGPFFKGIPSGNAEENLQARIRGNIIMALSNKFGWLVLTTGNKSETSVGYCTLYGDMAGGFAVIKDVPKMLVYALAKYGSDKNNGALPASIFTRPPSAELSAHQKDTDNLPSYETLDPILSAYIEQHHALDDIVSEGYPPDVVANILTLVDRNEYKRRQSPPGIKITPCAFGKDRRMPIVNHYRPHA